MLRRAGELPPLSNTLLLDKRLFLKVRQFIDTKNNAEDLTYIMIHLSLIINNE